VRTALGLILVLLGAAVMLYGLGTALAELIGLYQGALTDPLAEPAVSENDTSQAMIRAAIIGAAGIPVFVVGSVLLKITLVQRLRRKH
jgi:ascorbate-specific PTS system EIIC-type component UlaA